MTYIVIEIQTIQDGASSTLINAYDNQREAESRYHQILASAALSNIPIHAAVLMTEHGRTLKCEAYEHTQEA